MIVFVKLPIKNTNPNLNLKLVLELETAPIRNRPPPHNPQINTYRYDRAPWNVGQTLPWILAWPRLAWSLNLNVEYKPGLARRHLGGKAARGEIAGPRRQPIP